MIFGDESLHLQEWLWFTLQEFSGKQNKTEESHFISISFKTQKTAAQNEPLGAGKRLCDFFSNMMLGNQHLFFLLFLSAISGGDLIHVSNKITKAEKHSMLSSLMLLALSLDNYFYSACPYQ